MTAYRFYSQLTTGTETPPVLPSGYEMKLWRPSWTHPPPVAIRSRVQWVWWLFHGIRIFRNTDFSVLAIEQHGRLVHRAHVFPGFFRFPFMGKRDLQIGDIWTHQSERGRGLAGLGIAAIVSMLGCPERRFWYVVEDANVASIRVIEKAGFILTGIGKRVPRLGIGLLGYYVIEHESSVAPPVRPFPTLRLQ